MKRLIAVCLLALPAALISSPAAQAQCFNPHMGCGGFCMAFGKWTHQHGPLVNYTPGWGYAGGRQFGGDRIDRMACGRLGGGLGWFHRGDACGSCGWGSGGWLNGHLFNRGWFNRGCDSCGRSGWFNGGWFNGGGRNHGCDSCNGGWGHYAVSTFRNVFHRINPLAHRCGQSCSVGCSNGCSTGCSTGCK